MSTTWLPRSNRIRAIKSNHTDCVLFDLDGTFADTAQDLHYALNLQLESHGREPVSFQRLRPSVSHGSRAMLQVGFGIDPEHADFSALQKEFLDLYLQNIALQTQPFEGMLELLDELDVLAIRWGIVTNKPARLTDPLMQKLGLQQRASAVISGDTTPYAKPHPEPILQACRESDASPEHTLYIGDAQRDIEAGRNAGTRTLIAMFGYLGETDKPETWQADGQIDHPAQILDWL
ncbi:MAG: HAD-IA family hydrolase [Candidatus Thiodiazotropha lotti]|nr:HAD-IA family hydrolase [Candidatus Thiodiazotropha lotti]